MLLEWIVIIIHSCINFYGDIMVKILFIHAWHIKILVLVQRDLLHPS